MPVGYWKYQGEHFIKYVIAQLVLIKERKETQVFFQLLIDISTP